MKNYRVHPAHWLISTQVPRWGQLEVRQWHLLRCWRFGLDLRRHLRGDPRLHRTHLRGRRAESEEREGSLGGAARRGGVGGVVPSARRLEAIKEPRKRPRP